MNFTQVADFEMVNCAPPVADRPRQDAPIRSAVSRDDDARIRELLRSSEDYAALSSPERGRILRLIVNSDAVLQEAVRASASDSLPLFLHRFVQSLPADT